MQFTTPNDDLPPTLSKPMPNTTRIKAGLIHFCLSLSIFTVVFLAIFTFWYPEPFFTTEGGWQGLKIVASIDVVLGPLLTLVIFNPSKSIRQLSIDMGIIVALQLVALVWGVFTVYQHRPVAIVFWDDSFLTVAAADLTEQNYPLENLRQFSQTNPALIYAQRPVSNADIKRVLADISDREIPPHHQTQLYRPLAEHFKLISTQQIDIDKKIKDIPALQAQLDALLLPTQHAAHDLQYYPLKAKYRDIILVFTPVGELVGHLTPP